MDPDKLTLGNQVAICLVNDDCISGEVYTVDLATEAIVISKWHKILDFNTLFVISSQTCVSSFMIEKPAHKNTTVTEHVTILNASQIKSIEVERRAEPSDENIILPSDEELQRKEKHAATTFSKMYSSINPHVSPKAQQMFDRISHT